MASAGVRAYMGVWGPSDPPMGSRTKAPGQGSDAVIVFRKKKQKTVKTEL